MENKYLTQTENEAVKIFSERIKDLLNDNLVSIRLFGSKVRGDFSDDSDIDILIVLKEKDYALREKIYDILVDIDLTYDPKISLKIYTEKEMEKNKQLGSPFVLNVEREGLML